MILARLILGLLNLSPMSGYDLKKHFDASINHFWTADKAQIYRTLAALVRDGLATVQVVRQDSYPDRQEHRITEAGRAALHQWLLSDLEPQAERDAFLGRVFFAGELAEEDVTALLAERRRRAEAMLADFTEQRGEILEHAGTDRRSYLMIATLSNGIKHAAAELEWLDDVEREMP